MIAKIDLMGTHPPGFQYPMDLSQGCGELRARHMFQHGLGKDHVAARLRHLTKPGEAGFQITGRNGHKHGVSVGGRFEGTEINLGVLCLKLTRQLPIERHIA